MMIATKEKRIRLPGLEVTASLDAARAERITRSFWWRHMARPALRLLDRPSQQSAPDPSEQPQIRVALDPPLDPGAAAVWRRVTAINWYHTIDLGGGVITPGMVDLRPIADRVGLPRDLTGKRVLDVGTCDGFWAFEMERRGAAEVVALDLDSLADYDVPRMKRQQVIQQGDAMLADAGLQQVGEAFTLAREVLRSRVRREIVNVYDLSPDKVGRFDLVFVGYLLVHLRDPLTALENVLSVTDGQAIVVEPIDPDLERFERPLSSFVGTRHLGMWWEHNSLAWKAMALTAGFGRLTEVSRSELTFRSIETAVRMKTLALEAYPPER